MAHNWKTAPLKPEDEDKPALQKILSLMDENDKENFFRSFSINRHVSFETVFALASEPWDFIILSYNQFLTWENVQALPSKQWNYFTMLGNENISPMSILDAFDHPGDNIRLKLFADKWNRMLSGDVDLSPLHNLLWRRSMTWEFVQAHPEIPWDYAQMKWCPFITPDIIENNPHLPWGELTDEKFILKMGKNSNYPVEVQERIITTSLFQKRPDLFSFVDIDFIKKHPEVDWNWNELIHSPNITWNVILSNPEYPWPMVELCNVKFKDAPFEFIFSHLHLPWNFELISRRHEDLTWDIVTSHMHLPWSFMYLSAHPCINMTIVRKNRHIPWDFNMMSHNPNITWEDVWENRHENWCLSTVAIHTRDPCCTIPSSQLIYVLK